MFIEAQFIIAKTLKQPKCPSTNERIKRCGIYIQWNTKEYTKKDLKNTVVEETIGKTFSDINRTNVFLGQSPAAIEIKTKTNKWDLIKLTSFCTAKGTTNKTKRQPMEWEKNTCKRCD